MKVILLNRNDVFLKNKIKVTTMSRYQTTFETWNKVARLYQEKFMDLKLYDDTYDLFCDLIPKQDSTILELGCGPGNITKYLLSKRPDFKIKGIDVAPNMIALAKENNPTALFEVMDVRSIGELKERFDGIVCGFCLPYLSNEDVLKFLKDSKELLSENGILYLSFVEGEAENSGFQTSSTGDKVYFYYHQKEALSDVLKQNGFEIIHKFYKQYERKESFETHTILLSRKLLI